MSSSRLVFAELSGLWQRSWTVVTTWGLTLNNDGLCGVVWRKSMRSLQPNNECVEVADVPDGVLVRDSKDPAGPVLEFDAASWTSFVRALRDGCLG